MSSALLLLIIYLAFISLGLPDGALGVAWPAIRIDLGEPLEAAGAVTTTVTIFSAFSGFVSGRLLRRFGTGVVVLASCLVTGVALLGYSFAPSFSWILLLAVPLGFGAGAVDAGMNHYVAENYSARHMNWLHGFWGIGATVGPVIVGYFLSEPSGWRMGYRTIGSLQLCLALLFLCTLSLWRTTAQNSDKGEAEEAVARKSFPTYAPWMASLLFFVYAGLEMVPGLWSVTVLVEGRGIHQEIAALCLSCFYGSITLGRFIVGFGAARLGNRLLIRWGASTAIVGAAILAAPSQASLIAGLGLILLGLGCAPIYPCLMHEAPRRFDSDTARTVIGRQVAFAYVGGAILPASFGLLAAGYGLQSVMPGVVIAGLLFLALSEKLNKVT